MIPVDQTTFGVPGGNCFSACVASMLELPIEQVPYFMGADDWLGMFAEWLRVRGLFPLYFVVNKNGGDPWRPEGFYILGGDSPRGPHAVVARGKTIVHDPHPSRAGLITQEDVTLLVPIDLTQILWRKHAQTTL